MEMSVSPLQPREALQSCKVGLLGWLTPLLSCLDSTGHKATSSIAGLGAVRFPGLDPVFTELALIWLDISSSEAQLQSTVHMGL